MMVKRFFKSNFIFFSSPEFFTYLAIFFRTFKMSHFTEPTAPQPLCSSSAVISDCYPLYTLSRRTRKTDLERLAQSPPAYLLLVH